jgi:hypothetical protein
MSTNEPEFFNKVTQDNKTYELFTWGDPESSRQWLLTKKVVEPFYYIQVKTDQGVWGIDKEGLFLTNLLPWQTNLALAKHQGEITGLPNAFNLSMAVEGIADNFVIEVQCGKKDCAYRWMDGIRYQDKTIVRCPKCKEYTLIDSSPIRAAG